MPWQKGETEGHIAPSHPREHEVPVGTRRHEQHDEPQPFGSHPFPFPPIGLKELRENGVRNYAFISPIIPHLTDIEHLIEETKSFTDFYWFEFLNLKASGKEFREWLKQSYPESYEILSDKTKAEKYVKEVVNAIKKAEIFVKGICVHYPKLMVVK